MKKNSSNLITVVVKEPGKPAEQRTFEAISLEVLQGLVGGFIERLPTVPCEFANQDVVAYVDEEGGFKAHRPNVLGVMGNIVVVGLTADGSSVGLTPKAAAAVVKFFERAALAGRVK